MIEKSVIVTALFDIGRDKWSNYNQSYNTYLFWMDNILNVDSDFIIYTEEKFLDRVLESRKKIDKDLKRTKIILKNFEDLDSYKNELVSKFGTNILNASTILDPSEVWSKKIVIDDENFRKAKEKYSKGVASYIDRETSAGRTSGLD